MESRRDGGGLLNPNISQLGPLRRQQGPPKGEHEQIYTVPTFVQWSALNFKAVMGTVGNQFGQTTNKSIFLDQFLLPNLF